MLKSTGLKLQTETELAHEAKTIRTFCGTHMPTLNFTDPFAVIAYELEVAELDEKYRKLIEEGKA